MFIKAIQAALVVGGVSALLAALIAIPFIFTDKMADAVGKGGKHALIAVLGISLYSFSAMALFTFLVYLATGGK